MRGLHFVAVESTTAAEAHAQTRALMRSGVDLMYQGEIHYESTNIKKEQWMQLTLYATMLEHMQGVFPEVC